MFSISILFTTSRPNNLNQHLSFQLFSSALSHLWFVSPKGHVCITKAGKGIVALRVKWYGVVREHIAKPKINWPYLSYGLGQDIPCSLPSHCLQRTCWLGQNHTSKSTNGLSGARREMEQDTALWPPWSHTEERCGHYLGWVPLQW